MYGEVISKNELDAFKANLPPTEVVLAEWVLKTMRKGRLIHNYHIGAQKRIRNHIRYSLLDFTNIQVGYLSKTGDDGLDECEVNPGLYGIRLHIGPNEFKTFKHPNTDINDDAQKALIQVIFSSLKATRRELYRNSPQTSTALPIPVKQPPSPANTPPSRSHIPLKQDSFMVTLQAFLISAYDMHEPLEGVITITQKHFVFEPTVAELAESITIPLFKVVECSVLEDDEIPLDAKEFVLKNMFKVLQIFADGKKLCFPLPAPHAESVCARLVQWVQVAQDKLAQEAISMTAIQHPLLGKVENPTNFKGESDILSAQDVLYLQFKMPERHAMEKWELVYSTTKHGISINTFYTKVAQRAPSIIVVEDTNHHVFGAYTTDPWIKNCTAPYGSGESFLFKIKPVSKIFKWSKANDYFVFSKPDFISFGSGGDGYGLWLDSDFDHGSSATCDTYLNEPLSNNELFKVLRVEVWAPPVFLQKKTSRPR